MDAMSFVPCSPTGQQYRTAEEEFGPKGGDEHTLQKTASTTRITVTSVTTPDRPKGVGQDGLGSGSGSSTRIVGIAPRVGPQHAASAILSQPVYQSPRCQIDDSDLFPTPLPSASGAALSSKVLKRQLEDADSRWQYMSELAGEHKQDGSVLYVNTTGKSSTRPHLGCMRSHMTPKSLRLGILPYVAKRVLELHLDIGRTGSQDDDDRSSNAALPEWLDVISSLFFNLEHLYLGGITIRKEPISGSEKSTDKNTESQSEGSALSSASSSSGVGDRYSVLEANGKGKLQPNSSSPDENSAKLRRLYVLYRLPHLKSIDGIDITDTERELARPVDPNGQPVQRDEWVVSTSPVKKGRRMTVSKIAPMESKRTRKSGDDKKDRVELARAEKEDTASMRKFHSDPNIEPIGPRLKILSLSSPPRIRKGQDEETVPKSGSSGRKSPRGSSCGVEIQVDTEEKKEDGLTLDLQQSFPPEYQMKIDSPESATNGTCGEWSATCGSLSIPYFRDAKANGRQSQQSQKQPVPNSGSRGRLRLSFRRPKDGPPLKESLKEKLRRKSSSAAAGTDLEGRSAKVAATGTQQSVMRFEPQVERPSMGATAKEQEVEIEQTCNQILLSYTSTPPNKRPEFGPIPDTSPTREATAPDTLAQPVLPLSVSGGTENISHTVRIPPSKSLTSPFPMSFRVRARANLPETLDKELIADAGTVAKEENSTQAVGTSPAYAYPAISELSSPPPPSPFPPPDKRSKNLGSPVMQKKDTAMQAIPLARVKSSPSAIMQSSIVKGKLPPPFPAIRNGTAKERRDSINSLTMTAIGKGRRGRSRSMSWQKRISARSTSILDEEDDEEDEEASNPGHGFAANEESISDEENIASSLE